MKTFETYRLLSDVAHGDFTPGKSYPRINMTTVGNGGSRGFYWDDTGMVRMLKIDLFAPQPDGVWTPPPPAMYMPNKELQRLADRWGVVKQSVYNWQRGTQHIRWHDLVIGSQLPQCNDTVADLSEFAQDHGFYIQELAARWNMQQFGQYLAQYAAGRNPAYFWDLWRGMLASRNHGGYTHV